MGAGNLYISPVAQVFRQGFSSAGFPACVTAQPGKAVLPSKGFFLLFYKGEKK